jgi:hypothetical protein
MRCSNCNGRGSTGPIGCCPACKGAGFRLEPEEAPPKLVTCGRGDYYEYTGQPKPPEGNQCS